LTNNVWATLWAISFTNSSGHPARNLYVHGKNNFKGSNLPFENAFVPNQNSYIIRTVFQKAVEALPALVESTYTIPLRL
jgi:hypothetical protein